MSRISGRDEFECLKTQWWQNRIVGDNVSTMQAGPVFGCIYQSWWSVLMSKWWSTCSFRGHIANVCRSINFNIYSIDKIRKYPDQPTVEKLVNATMTSRLNYCNSLMFGIPNELITQLKMSQNHAARVSMTPCKADDWSVCLLTRP